MIYSYDYQHSVVRLIGNDKYSCYSQYLYEYPLMLLHMILLSANPSILKTIFWTKQNKHNVNVKPYVEKNKKRHNRFMPNINYSADYVNLKEIAIVLNINSCCFYEQ